MEIRGQEGNIYQIEKNLLPLCAKILQQATKENMKVLFISQEITPYLPETELSVISRQLPQAIQEKGKEIRTFMPRYGCINERRNQLHEVLRLSGMNLIINDTDHPLTIKVASIQSARMQVYFIDNEDFFGRKQIFCDEDGVVFPDNDERAIFFARGVLETVRKLRWAPDVIHCQGWFTGLIPLYVKRAFREDPLLSGAKVVYSIHDDVFSGTLDKTFRTKLLLPGITKKDVELLSVPNHENLTRLAVKWADALVQSGPEIPESIQTIVNESGKPFLPFQGQSEYASAYSDFYDKLFV